MSRNLGAIQPADSRDTKHFLAGLLWDDLGRNMRLDLNWNRGKTYCAYVSSNAAWSQREYRRAYRCSADNLDKLIIASVCEFLSDRGRLRSALKGLGISDEELDQLAAKGKAAVTRLSNTQPERLEELFAALLYRIEVGEEKLSIYFRSLELRRFLLWHDNSAFRGRPEDWPCSDARYQFEVSVRAITAERWPSLHIKPRNTSQIAKPDKKLVDLVQRARKAQRLVDEHREWSIEDLAYKENCRPTFFARLIRLNYLAPDIVTAILDGTQPANMTRDIMLMSNIPTDWAIQRQLFGFPAPEREISPRLLFGRGMWPTGAE